MIEYKPATISLDQLDTATRYGVDLALQEREIIATNEDPTIAAGIFFDPTLMGFMAA